MSRLVFAQRHSCDRDDVEVAVEFHASAVASAVGIRASAIEVDAHAVQ